MAHKTSLAPAGTTPVSGGRAVPFLGHSYAYFRKPLELMEKQYRVHGQVSELSFLGQKWALVLGPDALGEALINRDGALVSGDGWRTLIGPFFDRGLMLLDGDEHRSHRRILAKAFTRARLAAYTELMQPAIAEHVRTLVTSENHLAYPALKKLTLDIATELFMGGAEGLQPGEIDRVNRSFIGCVQAATSIVRYPLPFTRWRRGVRGRATLEEFFERYLPSRRERLGDDVFSVLCRVEADGERLSERDVINHMIFLMMAAHDTSTSTLSTVLFELGKHPEWQERCRQESIALETGSPNPDQLGELFSATLVIKECQRLITPVPVVVRRARADTTIAGHHIPKGTPVALGLHHNHHLPELWTDPERFDPERFSDERQEDKAHKFSWNPFGGGAHRCLGQVFSDLEVRSVLHHYLLNFRWTVPANRPAELSWISLPYPTDGMPIDLTRIG
ncbi:UNVERIFIED_CONTAM: cytochrome P450 [Williamsia faeni]